MPIDLLMASVKGLGEIRQSGLGHRSFIQGQFQLIRLSDVAEFRAAHGADPGRTGWQRLPDARSHLLLELSESSLESLRADLVQA